MTQQLPLTNVITISVSQASAGVGQYNTSNLAIFSDEVPAMSFGSLGYALYLSPQQVGIDFGTSSKTYAMANAIFSQQPNILAGNGYLCVILIGVATQTLALSGVPATGVFVVNYNGNPSANINWNDTAAMIQTKLQAVPGLSLVQVAGSLAADTLTVQMNGVYGATPAVLTVTGNTLQTSAPAAITASFSITTPGETWGAAITRSSTVVQYFGLMLEHSVAELGQTDLLAAAEIVQSLNKIAFCVSHTVADVMTGGMLDLLRSGTLTQMRGLFYEDPSYLNDINMMAAYAGRALSTNFTGSNTTQTMHLKPLITIQPDPNITQTTLQLAIAAGADTYVSLAGTPAVFCSGANKFFDQVYNLQWFVGALQVAGFNYLAQAATKIPQTEPGMDGLKGAYRTVCQQAVANQYFAPNAWNNATTFGVQADFLSNILNFGYYIYSTPIAQQSQANRAARQAPLCQIAGKEAGAVQESGVLINVVP